MDEIPVKVKTEKVDPEIEKKLEEQLCVKIKKEPLVEAYSSGDDENDEGQENDDSSSSTESNAAEQTEEVEDKKNIELQKSSNELLAELFQVFNVKPPEELLNDEDLLKKSKHKSKKSKKEKRKKHKKHKNEDSPSKKLELELDPEELQLDEKKEKHKHKKKKKHKSKDEAKKAKHAKDKEKSKIKTESNLKVKEKESDKKSKNHEHDRSRDREKTNEEKPKSSDTVKKDKHDDEKRKHSDSRKRHATDDIAHDEPPAKIKFSIEKRSHNSFYNGHSSERRESKSKDSREDSRDTRTKSDHRKLDSESSHKNSERSSDSRRHHHQRKSRDRFDKAELSDLSLSDEETYLRERARPTNDRRRDYGSFHGNRNRSDYERRHRPTPNRSHRRSSSRSHDLAIDKKRLLEIARKNAISMFKRGSLPGCANMSEDVKDKVLLQMRYGGRTVQDLTDFCRKISKGEPLPELSSDNDSDIDRNGNAKPFHHPFQVKDRDPVVLKLRNPIPIPPVSAHREEQTKAITMQFPVSSGQEHRRSESWIPVETKPSPPLPALPAASQSTNIFKQAVVPQTQKNVFEKALPAAEQQEPAFRPINNTSSAAEADSTSTSTSTAETTTTSTNSSLANLTTATSTTGGDTAEVTSTFVPDVPIPSSTTNDYSVFPEPSSVNVDVSSIISKRLNALRRLQENPLDSEAIKIMYNAQKEMTSWASSKHIPGQFTGSTGANVLRAHELNAGPQVWARRDQLTSTKPVTGGMGMHLLQKMGWKPGEGLGREKKGALQPLLLDVKLDKRGLVAKDDTGVNGIRPPNQKKRPNTAQDVIQSFQNKHPVCILNELTSKRKWSPPMYNLVTERGPSHNKKFLFSVSMNGQAFQPPEGSNTKKEAKMLAAKYCLEQIGILPT